MRWLCLMLCACASSPPPPAPPDPPDPVKPLAVTQVAVHEQSPEPRGAMFELTFTADPSDDPIGLEGLTDILVTLIASEGQERAAAYGATLEPIADGHVAGWRITGPRETFVQLATIVVDIAIDPRLPGTELATRTERWRELIRVRPDAAVEAARRWGAALAIGHGRPLGVEPTDATLATVNREDLVRLHRQLVRPERWHVDGSEPLPPELAARLTVQPSPYQPPRPCLAPTDHVFHMSGPSTRVRAAAAPPSDRLAWVQTLALALDRYPSLSEILDVDVRDLGDAVAVTTVGDDWARFVEALQQVTVVPASLVSPAWINIELGGSKGPELRRDGAVCRR